MKSVTPSRTARSLSLRSVTPVIITTGRRRVGGLPRIHERTSWPLIPGRFRSRRTTSGPNRLMISTASSPVPASSMTSPVPSTVFRRRLTGASSSTMRMRPPE
jgi:hypothetical protein